MWLDSGHPGLAIQALGGTGRVHDGALSRRIRETVSRQVFLAGGLHGGHVADAISAVTPFRVDLCLGERCQGRLDMGKLCGFMREIRRAVG